LENQQSLTMTAAHTFRADIQGLRGVAVLAVVAYHADERLLPGGFVGVDIFFVISGFLITGILTRELARGEMTLLGFYQRRVRRLFPALFVMLAVVLLAGAALLSPRDYSELARTALSTVFFVSNVDFYLLSGYFEGEAAEKPLLHTWSLAVEEQFYILFPLLLAFLFKTVRQHLALIVAIGALGAFAVSVWGAQDHRTAAFYLTPFRGFELAIGAVLALAPAPARLSGGARAAASLTGLALMAASFVLISRATPFPGFAALAPCLGAALVIFAGMDGRSLGGRAISFPALTFFGAISYSLYLWHWPILAFARHYLGKAPEPWQAAILVAAAIGAATASWRFVEQPVLRSRWSRTTVFALAAMGMALVSAGALAIRAAEGAPARFNPAAQALFAAAEDYNRRRGDCHSDVDHPIAYADNCLFGARDAAAGFAVWGDSAGAEFVVALGEALEPRGQAAMQITSSACPPALGYQLLPERPDCIAHNAETIDHLKRDARVRTVLLSLNFARYPWDERSRVLAGLERATTALQAAGKTVVLVYPFPNPWFNTPNLLGWRAQRGAPLNTLGVPFETYARDNHEIIAFLDDLSQRTGAVRYRLSDALCSQDFCPAHDPAYGALYWDGNHISVAGARLAMTHFPFEALPGEAQ
jgi:peptidoglycan/LPS O-acetylase OafA/YrhL